jgi:hypothetical protein
LGVVGWLGVVDEVVVGATATLDGDCEVDKLAAPAPPAYVVEVSVKYVATAKMPWGNRWLLEHV